MRNRYLGTGETGWHPLRKIRVALNGMRYAVVTDPAVAYKLAVTLIVLVACLVFRQTIDVSIVLLATGLMLVAETFNTAIEAICDLLEPGPDPRIRIIKDVAAAAVGSSILLWVLVMIIETAEVLRVL